MEYAEEDYEISNKVVSDYLHSLGYDDDYNELKKFDKKNEKNEDLTCRPVQNLNFSKFHPVAYLFNSEFLIELVQNNRQIFNESISDLDNQVIIKENLKFIQCLEDFSFIRSICYHKHFFFISFFLLLSLSALSIPIFISIIFILFILIFFRYKIITKFLLIWLNLSNKYLQEAKKIFVFIKHSDLVELSLKRRHYTFSSKSDINFVFRKNIFLILRKNFYQLKKINLELLNNIEQDWQHFICSINDSDLSPVMRIDGLELDELTDNYSHSCVNSIIKLNSILISENFKLIILKFFYLFQNGSDFFKFFILALNSVLGIHKFVKKLKKFEKLSKLINQEEETSKIVRVDPLNYEDNLILYLRSCLLNSFDLKNPRDNQAKAEKTKLIRMGLECCSLYLDQIETSLGLEVPQVKVSQASPDKPESENFATLQETISENQELIFEDEIFEAENDPNSMVKEKLKSFEPEELSPKEKQELLNTKNLFYELKYALKWKTNEWKEREKRAKHVNDRKPGEISEFGMRNENHLLDNDILIYKSGLRKRTDLKSELKQFNEKKSKYSNDEKLENYRNESHRSILSDIMAKRNKLMCQSDESEEIFGD